MPIYEYQCANCGYIFEEVSLKMGPIKLSTECPNCTREGKPGIAKKIMSSGSFVINGYNEKNGYARK